MIINIHRQHLERARLALCIARAYFKDMGETVAEKRTLGSYEELNKAIDEALENERSQNKTKN